MNAAHSPERMRVLVACEYSGTVRDAFIAAGHDAMSCDLLPSEKPGPHYQGDVRDLCFGYGEWDLMIAHPPCTYLSSSGLHWNSRRPERAAQTADGIAFARMFIDGPETAHIPRRVTENPIGCLSSAVRKPEQIIQPWMFGADASKATCLWLHGVDPLQPTTPYPPPDSFLRWPVRHALGQPDRQRAEQAGPVRRPLEAPQHDLSGHCRSDGEPMGQRPGTRRLSPPFLKSILLRSTDMPKFRKKPVVIDAVQFTEAMAVGLTVPLPDGVVFSSRSMKLGKLLSHYHYIPTLEGNMRVEIGDWIITGVKGERYPCKPDIFAATYEPA